jgi:hypothetical protein
MIIYASSFQLEILSKSDRWHLDGTFDAIPKQFYQVYTIHGWLFDEMHICAFILLTNKKQTSYKTFFIIFHKIYTNLLLNKIKLFYLLSLINLLCEVYIASKAQNNNIDGTIHFILY